MFAKITWVIMEKPTTQEKPMKKILAIVAIVLAAIGVAGVAYVKTHD